MHISSVIILFAWLVTFSFINIHLLFLETHNEIIVLVILVVKLVSHYSL